MSAKSHETTSRVQVTLSKFFSIQGSKAEKATIDQDNDIQVVQAPTSKKRSKITHSDDVDDDQAPTRKRKKHEKNDHSSYQKAKQQKDSSPKTKKLSLKKLSKFSVDSSGETEQEQSGNGDDQLGADVEGNQLSTSVFSSLKNADVSSKGVHGSVSQLSMSNARNPSTSINYTPLEQQFVDIKKQYPDAILFVECGYKFRFFGADAEIAAKVLKIFCHLDHNFLTASIPVHRLFVHVRRLVMAGYKVGVVKQTETAHIKAAGDNRSAPFSRQLSALYTKTTLFGEDVDSLTCIPDNAEDIEYSQMSLKPTNYLMHIWEDEKWQCANKTHIALVCVDPATGDIIYDSFIDGLSFFELETRFSHLDPAEIIISSKASKSLKKMIRNLAAFNSKNDDDQIRVEEIDDSICGLEETLCSLTSFFKQDPKSLQTVAGLPKSVQICVAVLIEYLKDFNLHHVFTLTSNFKTFTSRSNYMHLSSQCLHNLEIFHNSCDGSEKGSLFAVLNHTCTNFGTRLLKSWIGQPLLNESEINARLDAIEEIHSGILPDIKKLRDLLSKLPDLEKGLCSVFHKKCSPYEFYNLTTAFERVHKNFSQFWIQVKDLSSSSLLLELFKSIPELLSDISVYRASLDEKAAREKDKPNLFRNDSQFPSIGKRKEEIAQVISDINTHRKDVRLTLKQPGLIYATIFQTEFLIEVKNTNLKSVPSDWTQINSTKQVSRFHTPFIVKNYRKLKELRERLDIEVDQAWQAFQEQFSSKYVQFRKAVTSLAMLDCLLSLAQTASQDAFCRPKVSAEATELSISQGRHPIIDALNSEHEQFMRNDTSLGVNGSRVMIISGPNMGGKSSYIRQVALICIMAQVGSYVPAECAQLGILEGIYTRMGAADELFKGQSTFMVELQEANEIMSQASGKSLVILDELGRGTSTHDGVAIAYAALKHFITQTENLVLFVTHFPVLSEFERLFPGIVLNYHMSFIVNHSKEEDDNDIEAITFLYQLTEGAAVKSYGLNVARLASVPQGIIQRADAKSHELEGKMHEKLNQLQCFKEITCWQPEAGKEALVSTLTH